MRNESNIFSRRNVKIVRKARKKASFCYRYQHINITKHNKQERASSLLEHNNKHQQQQAATSQLRKARAQPTFVCFEEMRTKSVGKKAAKANRVEQECWEPQAKPTS